MANETNFASILDKAPSEVERPKPFPVGSYVTILQGIPRQDKSAKKETPFVEFTHKFVAAGEDVDENELAAVLGDRALTDLSIKNTFYLTEGSAWRLDEFLQHLGFELDGETSRREMIENSAGHQVGIYIKHEPSQDGQSVFARVGGSFVVE